MTTGPSRCIRAVANDQGGMRWSPPVRATSTGFGPEDAMRGMSDEPRGGCSWMSLPSMPAYAEASVRASGLEDAIRSGSVNAYAAAARWSESS